MSVYWVEASWTGVRTRRSLPPGQWRQRWPREQTAECTAPACRCYGKVFVPSPVCVCVSGNITNKGHRPAPQLSGGLRPLCPRVCKVCWYGNDKGTVKELVSLVYSLSVLTHGSQNWHLMKYLGCKESHSLWTPSPAVQICGIHPRSPPCSIGCICKWQSSEECHRIFKMGTWSSWRLARGDYWE